MICLIILWRPCFTEGRIRQASAGNLWDSLLLQDLSVLAGGVQVKAEGKAESRPAGKKIIISAQVSVPEMGNRFSDGTSMGQFLARSKAISQPPG